MKHRFPLALLVAALLMSLFALSVAAQPPTTGWWRFIQIQNIDTADGVISLTGYDSSGFSIGSPSYSIDAGSALAYHPGFAPNYPSGDRINLPGGSQVYLVSSDVDTATILQVANNVSGSVGGGGTASAFSQGIEVGTSQVINFPLVKNDFNGQSTTFYVQAGASSADVTMTYTMNDGTVATESRTIGANQAWEFSPLNAAPFIQSGCSGSGASLPCKGAATAVSTSGAIGGLVSESPSVGSPVPLLLMTRGLTQDDQGTKLLAPIIKNNFNGSSTGFAVQNVGTSSANVTINLSVTNASDASLIGNTYSATVAIEAGGNVIFSGAQNNLGNMPAGTFASATVESAGAQPLVGTISENKNGQKAMYTAFCIASCGITEGSAVLPGVSSATSKIAAPIVKDFFNGKTTGLVVANAGTAPTKIRASYTDAGGTLRIIESTNDIPAGGAISFFSVNTNPGNRFTKVSGFGTFDEFFNTKNAVRVESIAGQPIVAIVQESARDESGLDIKNYEGFNY